MIHLAATVVLPLLTLSSDSQSNGLEAQWFNNSVLFNPACNALIADPGNLTLLATQKNAICDGLLAESHVYSVRMYGQLHLPPGQYQMKTDCNGAIRFWVHGWKLVDEFSLPSNVSETIGKYNFTVDSSTTYPVRIDALFTDSPAILSISYRVVGQLAWNSLPQTAFSPIVSSQQRQRQALQLSLSSGWNTWNRASATAHVHLPSAFGFDVTILDPSKSTQFHGGIVDRCIDGVCKVRPGVHTSNGSFTHFDQLVRQNELAVAVKSAHVEGSSGHATVVLLQANTTEPSANQLVASVKTRFYFDCAPHADSGDVPCGNITVESGRNILGEPISQNPVRLRGYGKNMSFTSDNQGFSVTFDGGVVCMAAWTGSNSPPISSMSECISLIAAAEQRIEADTEAQYPRARVGNNRDVVDAIRAVIGWNTMWDGRAFVITPVSRSFGQMPFEMWLWDTYFSTLLSAEHSKELAYSNLIEITRPTVAGNVPGFRTATESVQDRSKPFVGAMVLEMLYHKFGDIWLVELLFDDMLMWANWIRDKRTEEPAGLIVLGSDNVAKGQSDGAQCTREAVLWESGLDNSPMYDSSEIGWNYQNRSAVPIGTSCRIHLYDAGMTGLYLSMLDSLSNLAGILNRTNDAQELRTRHADMTERLNKWLWNETMGVYTNVQSRGQNRTSTRISPFNFHPMLSGAASASQAKDMALKWLLTDGGFCLTEANDSNSEVKVDSDGHKSKQQCAECSYISGLDAHQPAQQVATFKGPATITTCCAACKSNALCETFVLGGHPDHSGRYQNCWLLANVTSTVENPERSIGCVRGPSPEPPAHMPCNFGVPSIAHNDTGYTDQSYWRGRVWGPMNFLVYKGLNHPAYKDVEEVTVARKRLVDSSRRLLLQEWLEHHHVHENYDAGSGEGCNKPNSNPFYHWGALTGLIGLIEDGLW